MKMVVITSIVVRFTLKAASKKNCLKNVVAKVININNKEGKRVRFWTAKSAFAKKSALESAFFSAKKVFSYRKD